ncbi:hypothetical protein [Butyrivibrio proteoclasticus]|uniref:hypothetical protein n=1 Tax=Butyrivibrio proteoclasticus TaxID=43305 RepID=UPI000684FC37|nr:hypothetical protein [Butyrivibrio proteoclasticus]
MIFCTLFDSYYLDKGLALYNSLLNVTNNFKLYIYAFDDVAYNVLSEKKLQNVVALRKEDLETSYPILNKLKEERSKAEYSWTCTPVAIEYVLKHFNEESCTYIDADLYFFSDPQILFNEIKSAGANVLVTPHRFTDSIKDRRLLNRSGKYCVEFNYFDNSENSLEALSWWKEKCFEWCYHIYEKDRMGDQKYIEKFPEMFEGVHELENLGGGVAPWNLAQYEYTGNNLDNGMNAPVLREKATGKEFPIVFYHFQSMRYISEDLIIIRSETHSKKTKDIIYRPYLTELEKIRQQLKKQGITFYVAQSYASNPIIKFVQKYILRFKMKSLTDVYNLKKLRKTI